MHGERVLYKHGFKQGGAAVWPKLAAPKAGQGGDSYSQGGDSWYRAGARDGHQMTGQSGEWVCGAVWAKNGAPATQRGRARKWREGTGWTERGSRKEGAGSPTQTEVTKWDALAGGWAFSQHGKLLLLGRQASRQAGAWYAGFGCMVGQAGLARGKGVGGWVGGEEGAAVTVGPE